MDINGADCDLLVVKLQNEEEAADKCETPEMKETTMQNQVCASIPKVNKMTEDINEVISWMEHHTGCEHLQILHLFYMCYIYIYYKRAVYTKETTVLVPPDHSINFYQKNM